MAEKEVGIMLDKVMQPGSYHLKVCLSGLEPRMAAVLLPVTDMNETYFFLIQFPLSDLIPIAI